MFPAGYEVEGKLVKNVPTTIFRHQLDFEPSSQKVKAELMFKKCLANNLLYFCLPNPVFCNREAFQNNFLGLLGIIILYFIELPPQINACKSYTTHESTL